MQFHHVMFMHAPYASFLLSGRAWIGMIRYIIFFSTAYSGERFYRHLCSHLADGVKASVWQHSSERTNWTHYYVSSQWQTFTFFCPPVVGRCPKTSVAAPQTIPLSYGPTGGPGAEQTRLVVWAVFTMGTDKIVYCSLETSQYCPSFLFLRLKLWR